MRIDPLLRSGSMTLAAALLPVLLAAGGCAKKKAPPAPPAVPVTAAEATARDVPVTLHEIGSVEAFNTVMVTARVGGELQRVAVREGQNVRAGELLFRLDTRPFEAALQSALADSVRDLAKAVSAEADERRYADLVQKDFVTREQYEAMRANAVSARATVDSDAAACRSARLDLGYCTIRAPLAGRVGDLLVDEGNLVRANDVTPLLIIRQIVPIYISFSAPSQYLPDLRRYADAGPLRVEATVAGDSTTVHVGQLTFINNTVDTTTGTILLKATFPNTDESLWPGEFTDVSLILTTRRGAILVPSQSVQRSQQGDFVYLIKPDQTVAAQPVTTGADVAGETVIERGVQSGDRVVTDGQLRLVPGARVDIQPGTQLGGAEHP